MSCDELLAVRQRDLAGIDVARLLLVDEEQVAAAGAPGDVDVLADLDEAVGAEDRQPAVAPRRQAVRREPVDADVAGAAVAAQHHVAEVFELRDTAGVDVADLRRNDLGASSSR